MLRTVATRREQGTCEHRQGEQDAAAGAAPALRGARGSGAAPGLPWPTAALRLRATSRTLFNPSQSLMRWRWLLTSSSPLRASGRSSGLLSRSDQAR